MKNIDEYEIISIHSYHLDVLNTSRYKGIHFFSESAQLGLKKKKSKAIFIIPLCFNAKQKEEMMRRIEQYRYREIYFMPKCIVAAYGLQIPFNDKISTMFIYIGSSDTEICIFKNGKMLILDFIDIGGEKFNRSITEYLAESRNLFTCNMHSEQMKLSIGSLMAVKNSTLEIKGRDIITNQKCSVMIDYIEINSIYKVLTDKIIKFLYNTITSLPPECRKDISQKGIYVSGGGSKLKGLPQYLFENINIEILHYCDQRMQMKKIIRDGIDVLHLSGIKKYAVDYIVS